MHNTAFDSVTLPAEARNVGIARRTLSEVMSRSGADADVDAAVLALSEIVTNAFVHTGAHVTVRVWSATTGTRVEVEDSGSRLPVLRRYADTAGTGRGLHLVEELTDRWGAHQRGGGKTVWFEIGDLSGVPGSSSSADHPDIADAAREVVYPVTLRRAPLLMHWAWQEHGSALLREYLLHVLDQDDTILDKHAEASEAMSVLSEQLPAPDLSEDPEMLMAGALEPGGHRA